MGAFNSNGIVYDNSPWRPGRDIDVEHQTDDERKLKSLATRIMSNGVEVLVKDKGTEGKHEQTKYMEFKTLQTSSNDMFSSNLPQVDKRIDSEEDSNFDLIQPSEVSHASCTTSCSCSHTKTENLKTKYTNIHHSLKVNVLKTTKFNDMQLKPTNKNSLGDKSQYRPYEYETSSHSAPTDKIVEKYTEVLSDMSDEKDKNSLQESDLLTNEQAPTLSNKGPNNKTSVKKPQVVNKNKLVVAELIKLGSLGIKGLSQLAPVVIEKMTGGFMKRQDNTNKLTSTTTTVKPVTNVIPYSADKRVDTDGESNHGNFPIYIPVDEMETSESQAAFTNATLHHNFVWANDFKHSKAHVVPPKLVHESALVNGGIPISPGEIITANSDVIVGKPAVGGPLTLVASGMKLQNPVNPPPIDNFVLSNEKYSIKEKPTRSDFQSLQSTNVDDSFDLRPPELPKIKPKYNNSPRPLGPYMTQQRPISTQSGSSRVPLSSTAYGSNDNGKRLGLTKNNAPMLANHGRPAFLDYIPSLVKTTNNNKVAQNNGYQVINDEDKDLDIADNNPSSSEVVSSKITTDGYVISDGADSISKPFLVDIQPSKVANVLIPHGSSTALVFAGSSEPHKTGDYVDDPLPYPEPGYFGSFSIDAPHMTNVHNVSPNKNQFLVKPSAHITFDTTNSNKSPTNKESQIKYDQKIKWNDNKRPKEFNKIPLPTSNQETHIQVGPQITIYNPDSFKGNLDKFNQFKPSDNKKEVKEVIDKDYENYLAVPPPPKVLFHRENYYDTNKPYYQRPITRTKPIHDTKVILNIQHPAPSQLPPKVTSEVYFATQLSNGQQVSNYNIRLPQSQPAFNSQVVSHNNQYPQNNLPHKTSNQIINSSQNSVPVSSYPEVLNKSLLTRTNGDNTYSVTLNSASNIESNSNQAHVLGSSISVPLSIASQNDQMNANIPIGTNFAIRVEDDPAKYETVALHGKRISSINYDDHSHVTNEILINQNSNKSWNEQNLSHLSKEKLNSGQKNKNELFKKEEGNLFVPPSLNSHANFPMMSEHETVLSNDNINIFKQYDKNLPGYQTNSHGWYSSILNEGNLKNIHIESSSTRTMIPLNYDSTKDNIPEFGQKITTVGKPPTNMWDEQTKHITNNFHIGKPFSKPNEFEKSTVASSTSKLYNTHYIPSTFFTKQPVYDIPIRDDSQEITTTKIINTHTEKVKPVYENAEEVFDGEELIDNTNDHDGEVSSESMKVPIITSARETDNRTKDIVPIPQNISPEKPNNENKKVNLVEFNPDTQTEKPFGPYTRPAFQSNNMKPIYEHVKPRPFTINPVIPLDHHLQQPHWQINQLLENSTNISYEDNIDLNIGEEINSRPPKKGISINKNNYVKDVKNVFQKQQNTTNPNRPSQNNSNIITSTIHLKDKKPLTVDIIETSTLPTFTIPVQLESNHSANEIIDLSPPPPISDNNFKSSINTDLIMGMSPPPPQTPPSIFTQKTPQTSKPIGTIRTPPLYLQLPPKTLPARLTTQRPIRKPISRDEVSTYRPIYDFNKVKRPIYNRDQPSSHLMPPPMKLPTKISFVQEVQNSQAIIASSQTPSTVIFPTPISSGWLTSSGVEFSSGIKFAPTSVYFPDIIPSSKTPDESSTKLPDTSLETLYSYEYESSDESIDKGSENPIEHNKVTTPKLVSTTTTPSTPNVSNTTESNIESSQEDLTREQNKTTLQGYKMRTRKPYPSRYEDKKTTTSKYKVSSKPFSIIKPTRTLTRPAILYPTRSVSIKKILRPVSSKTQIIHTPSIIESSESSIEEYFIKPTEILDESTVRPTLPETTSIIEKTITSTLNLNGEVHNSNIKPTNYAGNEIKISDEIIPTKTEFRTTIVTLTKTLSEPPHTVSSIGFVNLTHTLTVTHTKTSLVSQGEGAVTQTLVLTNTQTSTIVDIITEVYTQVEPTTIIETVTKHIPIPQLEATPVQDIPIISKTALDDISMSSEESDNFIIRDSDVTENIQKIELEEEKENDTFFVVMNKSQNGGKSPPISTELETGDFEGITRNEQVNNNGVSQVLFGEILLAGTPYLETTNVGHPTGIAYGKECQPDCKASRNERCQRIDGIMKCVCRPGFARMFPDRPCKPTYTYSVGLALGSQGNQRLLFHESLADNSSKEYNKLAAASYEGINRMIMQSDLRDVYHGVHITKFRPIEIRSSNGEKYQGVVNDFYVQLSDNAHESRLKEVIEKYLRHNNYSLGGTSVHAADQLLDRLNVSDFDECVSRQFHDCSEHARCFNLRGTYTCSCLEGFADLSVNTLYPGRICSSEAVGCAGCNYHGTCFERESTMICECFKWYSGKTCQVNLKAVLITVTVSGAVVVIMALVYACKRCCCRKGPATQTFVIGCMQGMPSLHQGNMPSKQRADRRALIAERPEAAESCSMQNTSLPYVPSKQQRTRSSTTSKKLSLMGAPPAHAPPPPPAPAVLIPRARLHHDSRDNLSRKKSLEACSEAKLISYLESGASNVNEEMRRKHSVESSYSINKEKSNKQGALVSAGFKVSTTVRPEENLMRDDRDDNSSINKNDLEAELSRFDNLRKSYSQDDMSEWTDAERRIGELTLSEARSIGGTLPASTGRAASSTRLTHQEANTMAERDLGSTFLLPHVHLYKPDLTSDVSEFDSL